MNPSRSLSCSAYFYLAGSGWSLAHTVLVALAGHSVGGWTRQPLESPNPEESTKKPVITIVVVIAAGGAGLPS
ncbi:hypothetical protein ALC62_00822 [Cyphomyrmex costatus]|uniref:Uncharacterized protein n=1 Tax=Cyphomyrmex costatus TaxID=456900 RepID=A0A151IPX5_9HYME|nr:hypothetical protein ALC62_00822 [Cyphomyrmex costatus]